MLTDFQVLGLITTPQYYDAVVTILIWKNWILEMTSVIRTSALQQLRKLNLESCSSGKKEEVV